MLERVYRDSASTSGTLYRRVLGVSVALVIAAGAVVPGASARPAQPTPPFFGTLATASGHAAAESAAGIKVAMLELSWSSYEPKRDVFDVNYAAGMKARMRALLGAGMRVTLGFGLHFPPLWIRTLPGSRFVDQYGHKSDEVNLVFNALLRNQAETYFRRIALEFGMKKFWAVRLTSGGDPEVLYPGGGSYWAFDQNAQNGVNLPRSMQRNPFPGWRPGQRSLAAAQVRRWADWYVHALDDVVEWQMRSVRLLGFSGYFQVLTPGSGTRPDGFSDDIVHYLPASVTAVGAVWDRFYAALMPKRHVVAYISSLADRSGRDDGCLRADDTIPLTSPGADGWSSARWISRVADRYGLAKAGENPGWNYPAALNSHYVDRSESGMMAAAVRQVTTCHMQGLYWAHDDKLWDGTMPFSNYSRYARRVGNAGALAPAFP